MMHGEGGGSEGVEETHPDMLDKPASRRLAPELPPLSSMQHVNTYYYPRPHRSCTTRTFASNVKFVTRCEASQRPQGRINGSSP